MDIPMDIKSMYFKDCSYNFQNVLQIHLLLIFTVEEMYLSAKYVGWTIMKTGLDVRNVDSSFMLVA